MTAAHGEKTVAFLNPELQAHNPGSPLEGWVQIPNRVLLDLSLSLPGSFALRDSLLGLDESDRETMTLDDLAEHMGSSKPSVIRYLGELERADLLTIDRRTRPHTYRLATVGADAEGA